jgi:DNA-binding beta-propeller fold protein YncE
MRTRIGLIAFVIAASLGLHAAQEPYRFIKAIPIGGPGGWDYISLDSQAHRLYVSHATKVVVVDLDTDKVVGEIAPTPGVHGFAVAPDLGRGFSSNGRENASTIVDLKTLAAIAKVETGGNPDAVIYEPAHREVYTLNGSGKSATVFDAQTGKVTATIDLGGKPEAPAADRAAHRIFVNLEDTNQIAVIDTSAHAVVAKWPLTGCEEPTGLGYDPGRHRLFSACHNKVMTATDSLSGKVVATVPIGARTDGAAFDPATGYAFASNGEGTVTIARLDASDRFTVVQTLKTEPSARTMVLDAVTHNIYLPAATMTTGADGRSQAAPDSFRVLVYGMK